MTRNELFSTPMVVLVAIVWCHSCTGLDSIPSEGEPSNPDMEDVASGGDPNEEGATETGSADGNVIEEEDGSGDDGVGPTDDREKVIVVGAGLSGLAAARTLHDDGCCTVTVLEAQDRVGGRIFSVKMKNGDVVEASAAYHAGKKSSLDAVIKEIGMRREKFEWSYVSYDSDGSKNPVSSDDWDRFFTAVEKEAEKYADDIDFSLENLVDEMASGGAFSYLDNDREVGHCVASLFEQEYSADASKVRAYGLWEGEDLTGGDEWFPDGMSAITEHLAKGLDIRLGEPVAEILYGSDGVTVKTVAGAIFTADRVIVTVSLGVLKAGDIAFDPPLPATKTSAIERLGMGLMDKVWLSFDTIFWDDAIDFMGYLSDPPGQYSGWNYYGGHSIMVWHAGKRAIELEYKNDEEIIKGSMDTLRVMYGDNIPEPSDFLIERFDPQAAVATSRPSQLSKYTKGSYSYLKVGSSPKDRGNIATPVIDRVFFAGEHTSQDHPALIQGAYESGIREAENILSLQ